VRFSLEFGAKIVQVESSTKSKRTFLIFTAEAQSILSKDSEN